MKKRIMSVVLAILFMFPLYRIQAAEANADLAQEKLRAFGVLTSDDAVKGDLNRGQLAMFAVRMLGIDASQISGATPFTDTSAGDKRTPFITAAYHAGLLKGTGAGIFEPDGTVTVAQAVKVMVNLLGYSRFAEEKGGYPGGYMITADRLKLLKGINADGNRSLSMQEATILFLNTLETDIMEYDAVGTDYSVFQSEKNRTLLSEKLKIKSAQGILEADEYTSIYGTGGCARGNIQIDGIAYLGNSDLLGMHVECYYTEDGDQRKALYVDETKKNVTFCVDAEDINADGVTKDRFSYFENNDLKEEKIPRSATLILNGKQAAISKENLTPAIGNVTFTDHNNDGTVDVISVTSYETLVVNGYSKESGLLAVKYGKESEDIGPDSDFDAFIFKNGKKAEADSLKEWDVILMAKSLGDKPNKKILLASDATVEGIVSEVSEDAAVIGDATYQISEQMKRKLTVGSNGVFYLDVNGRIAAAVSERDTVYGYLYKMQKESLGDYSLRIFTENNRWVTLMLKDKLKLNGETRTKDEVFAALSDSGNPGMTGDGGMLIRYNVDDDKKINRVFIAKETVQWSDEAEQAAEEDVFCLGKIMASARYRDATQSFENQVFLNGETKIFCVPSRNATEDDFRIASFSEFGGDEEVKNIYAYDLEKNGTAGACVVSKDSFTVNRVSNLLLVYKTSVALNREGNMCDMIHGSYKGYDIKLYTKDETTLANLPKTGDIVQFLLDADGYVADVIVRYKADDGAEQKFARDSAYNSASFIAGQVKYADSESGRVIIDYGTDTGGFDLTLRLENVYLYDRNRNKVKKGTVHDLVKDAWVFGRFRFYQANEIFIIQEG